MEEKRKKGRVICSICNTQVDYYFDDFTRFPMKFYINDKVGFSQKLSNKWFGNFSLCEDCYLSILTGEKFIQNNLKERLGRIDYIVIPEIINGSIKPDRLESWKDYLISTVNVFKFLEKNEFKKRIEEYKKYGLIPYFLLNYLFFIQNNQEFRVYTLIKDVPEDRLEELKGKFYAYQDRISEKFSFIKTLKGYEEIYKIIPLRISKSDGKILDIPKITNLLANIIEGSRVDLKQLIHDFSVGIRAKRFENTSYHIVSGKEDLENYILLTNQLIILLKEIGLIEGGGVMSIDIPKEFKDYISEVGFGEKETALFLLGTLIGDIGRVQAVYGSKPILNKINFQGMSLERLKVLFNEIYESLKYNKLLSKEREIIYAKAKELFDKHLKDWDLKPYENVYYLLSGYAFKTKLELSKKEVKDGG